MQAMEAVSMIVVFVVLAVIPYDVQAQTSIATSGPCRPECSTGGIPISIKAVADAAYKSSSYASKISGLEARNQLISSKIARCPCSSCTARSQLLYTCGRCYIYWPFNGLINANCATPNTACKLGCGCNGTCQMHGSAYRWVLLYCPHKFPPWEIKQVRVCTNCCCQA